jgi:hypothetical protein
MTLLTHGRQVRSSADWVDYFEANAARDWAVPWERGAEVTSVELAAIAR